MRAIEIWLMVAFPIDSGGFRSIVVAQTDFRLWLRWASNQRWWRLQT